MLNSISLIGRLTKDAEVLTTKEDSKYARFTLAVSKTNADAMFVDCVAFGKAGEVIAQYTKLGFKVAVVGRLDITNYKRKDGTTARDVKIVVSDVELLTPKTEEKPVETKAKKTSKKSKPEAVANPDDMPF